MSDDRRESVLGRWSRLKRTRATVDAKAGQGAAAPMMPGPGETSEPATGVAASAVKNTSALDQPPQPEDLPDIGSLTRDSDFTVFLRAGVPEDLRRQALRVLWRSDPVLANLDGLNDYDGDYRASRTAAGLVQTAYRVGKGYLKATDETVADHGQAAPTPAGASEEVATAEPGTTTAAADATIATPPRNDRGT